MTNSTGARWEQEPIRTEGGERPTVVGGLSRRSDGRWIASPRQANGAAAGAVPIDGVPNPSTTELAVTRARYNQTEADWDAVNQYDPEFEAASSRFFETDPGNRLTYEHLLADDDTNAGETGTVGPAADQSVQSYPDGRIGNGYVDDLTGYARHQESDPVDHDDVVTSVHPVDPYGHGPNRQSEPVYAAGSDYNGSATDDPDSTEVDEDELATGAAARRNAIEWAVVLVAAVLLALVLRALVLQAFYIPSPSMEDTLLIQDRVLVNKLSYRFGEVGRGDIVVFHRTDEEIASAGPTQPKDVIKRVIALGGETIEIRESTVYINDQELEEPYLEPGLLMPDFGPLTVPDGFLFVMGDNRNLSSDSRGELGPIAEDRVVGRAFVLFWPVDRLRSL